MDLLANLRTSLDTLPQGAHSSGLRAVLVHIEAAYRHLGRAEGAEADESAYTDAIYRCNQAFEGGVKEAYRVLTGDDPSKKTIYDIEKHLEKNSVFRDRVLSLFTNYRTEWRNKSTHDYTLDFDGPEAFLAIVSISGFTKLLIDQVSRSLKNSEASDTTGATKVPSSPEAESWNLLSRVAYLSQKFCCSDVAEATPPQKFVLQLAQFLSLNIKDSLVEVEPQLATDRRYRPDLVLRHKGRPLIIETKQGNAESMIDRALVQLDGYMGGLRTNQALLVSRSKSPKADYRFYDFHIDTISRVLAVLPKTEDYEEATLPVQDLEPR